MVSPRALVLGLAAVLAAGVLSAESTSTDGQTMVLKGARLDTQTSAGSYVGSIVIRNGKIVAIGPVVPVPTGATVIDATDCTITPGLIDAHGMLGLNRAAAGESGQDAQLNVLDAVDPFAEDWRDAARQGVTAVYVQPAAGGYLGGSGALLRVCGADCADGLALRAQAAMQMALGTPPRAPAAAAPALSEFLRGRGINLPTQPAPTAPPPVSTTLIRYAQYEQVKNQFDAAKRYGESKPARPDPAKDLLLRATKSEIATCVEVHHEDDVRNALRLAAAFGLRPVFERVDRATPFPEELVQSRSALIIGPLLGRRPSAELRKLAIDGRRFAIGTFGDDPRASCGLRVHAAAAVAAGFPRERVMSALTSDAAELFGVGDRVGRLQAGHSADLVVFAGDPLDPSTPVRLTLSEGRTTYADPKAELTPVAGKGSANNLPAKLPPSFVLKTQRLLTPAGEFVPGEIHVVDGVLTASNGSSPPLVIDVGDSPVTPGFVAAHVAMPGVAEPDADAAQLRAADGVAEEDARMRNARSAGFLTSIVAPASTNVLAGTAAAIRSADGVVPPETGLKFVLTNAARSRERYPSSLAGQVELIDARLRGAPGDTTTYLPLALRSSLLADRDRVLYAVRNRQLTACFEAQTSAEVRAALRLMTEHGLRGVLLMPRDVNGLTDEIRQAGVPVVIGPVRPQETTRVVDGLVALGKAGVPLALGGDAAEARVSAAWLTNHGLPRSAMRRALLAQPTEAFGLPHGVGRLMAGDSADFVVWTGDPLDLTARPAAVVVQGKRMSIGEDSAAPAGGNRGASPPAQQRGRRR